MATLYNVINGKIQIVTIVQPYPPKKRWCHKNGNYEAK